MVYDKAKFDADTEAENIIHWIQNWFLKNGPECNAIVGISGGKDSSVVAALCVNALGADRVIGVMMPNLSMGKDAEDATQLCEFLGIRSLMVPVTTAVADIMLEMRGEGLEPSTQTVINLPARIRMATLYAVSQTLNGRVANTCNLSEDWVGYSTRYGDSAGDFCPIADYTVTEVKAIGTCLGLPDNLVNKTPSDGLCGRSDEDNLGFTYDVLDTYIRTGVCEDKDVKNKIDILNHKNSFKLRMPDRCLNLLPLPLIGYHA